MLIKDTLQAVLDRAHAGHRYITDVMQYRRPEHWQLGLIGDCEDFALWCRQELAALGIEADLVLCGVVDSRGDHLVCSVDGWILDNRHRWVMARQDLPYTWVSLGKPDGNWFEIA